MTDGLDDAVLVKRLLARADERAFGMLYDRHTPYLYRFALRLTGGDDALAQDVVHDVWLHAVERLGAFEWRSELRTWLAGFVVNRVRRSLRTEAANVSLDEAALTETASHEVDFNDKLDLDRAIALLPPRFREVLVLHDVEGFTHEEIAELLDIQPGTSKSQLARARIAARKLLAPGTSH